MSRHKDSDPQYQGEEKETDKVPIKKEVHERYEGYPTPSPFRCRLFGFYHLFDRQVELELKKITSLVFRSFLKDVRTTTRLTLLPVVPVPSD